MNVERNMQQVRIIRSFRDGATSVEYRQATVTRKGVGIMQCDVDGIGYLADFGHDGLVEVRIKNVSRDMQQEQGSGSGT